MRKGPIAILVVVVALAAACGVPKLQNRRRGGMSGRCEAGQPRLHAEGHSGKEVRLADYKGKVVLLDFWATWCGPCKIEIPGFIELYAKYKAQGLEVVGVVMLDKFENAKPYAEKMKMTYPILNGDEQQDAIDNAYGPLFGLPMSFIISRDGRVCQKHLGLPGATKDKDPDAKSVKDIFEAQIKALL